VYLRNASGEFTGRAGGRLSEERDAAGRHFFDPLALGLGYGGELDDLKYSLKVVADAYRQWSMNSRDVIEDDRLIRFRCGFGNDYEEHTFDKTQECAPVNARLPGRSGCVTHTESGLFAGIYLPTRCYYETPGRREAFELDWISVNEPLPPRLFDVEVVQDLMSPTVLGGDDPAAFDEAFLLELLRWTE
jgi:hypothetical protein